MSEYVTSEESKAIMVDLLRQFHVFCEEHGLVYFIAWGTLLGAVRHKGMIPWDDDIDVLMPRPDYERFVQEWKDFDGVELFARRIPRQSSKRNALISFAKLADVKYTEIESPWRVTNDSRKLGVYIDIGVLDGCEDLDTELGWKRHKMAVLRDRIRYARRTYRWVWETFPLKNVIRQILKMWFCRLSIHKYLDDLESLMKRKDISEAKHVADYSGFSYSPDREIMEAGWFKERTLLQFENLKVWAVKDYDALLRRNYGDDYMIPPPEDQRNTRHVELIKKRSSF